MNIIWNRILDFQNSLQETNNHLKFSIELPYAVIMPAQIPVLSCGSS